MSGFIFSALNKAYKCRSCLHIRYFSHKKWNVIFFGTDEFSLFSLERLYNKYVSGDIINNLEVVTNIKSRKNVVHKFAEKRNLYIHNWPLQATLEKQFDVGVVVSFGHLIPKSVIKLFPLGILNVHASLLPKWRGAAPIVHCLLNGDTKTGVTIMKIQPKHFDIGEIILQKEISIREDVLQTELYEKLGKLGAEILEQCINTLPDCLSNAKSQDSCNASYDILNMVLAPKIGKHIGIVKWKEKTAQEIYNLSRALYGIYPLLTRFQDKQIRLNFLPVYVDEDYDGKGYETKLPGHFKYIKRKNIIQVWCKDGSSVYFDSVSVLGKKIMSALDFKNGFFSHLPENQHYFTSDDLLLEDKIVVKSKL